MTLLGSPDPRHTPPDGTLAIWIRPLEGDSPGRRLSQQRWAHSPVWSPSGRAIAYVVNGEWPMSNSEFGRTMNRDATVREREGRDATVREREGRDATVREPEGRDATVREPEYRDATNADPARGSFIAHLDLNTGVESALGAAGAINCLPRFDTDRRGSRSHTSLGSRSPTGLESRSDTGLGSRSHIGDALLFCAGEKPEGPFRVYRQRVGDPEPVALTPLGSDCLFPVVSDAPDAAASTTGGTGFQPVNSGRAVLCAEAAGEHLAWVTSRQPADAPSRELQITNYELRTTNDEQGEASTLRNSSFVIRNSAAWGLSARPAMLQTWGGIASPLSPDRQAVLFYDTVQDRVCVLSVNERIVQRHRPRSIAGCWLDPQSIALATPDGVFVVNRTTGLSIPLFNGQWIPCRYVPTTRRLILLGRVAASHRSGQRAPRRFEIWEVVFKGRAFQEQGQ